MPGAGGQISGGVPSPAVRVATLAQAQSLEQVLESLILALKPFIGFEQADVVAWEAVGAAPI